MFLPALRTRKKPAKAWSFTRRTSATNSECAPMTEALFCPQCDTQSRNPPQDAVCCRQRAGAEDRKRRSEFPHSTCRAIRKHSYGSERQNCGEQHCECPRPYTKKEPRQDKNAMRVEQEKRGSAHGFPPHYGSSFKTSPLFRELLRSVMLGQTRVASRSQETTRRSDCRLAV